MKRRIRNKVGSFIRIACMPLLMVVAIAFLLGALGNMESGQEEEKQKQVEDTIKKAVVNCYATEGVYPATLRYVEKYYGLQIDHERYDVFYDIFADNIMPEITVVPKKVAKGDDAK
ncbi:hypothetical protein SAMN02910358_01768 [Lachnospiraceae bacterium XBB1006]|nr:hypothetical protein SAMN02910358_01768 [Lachnospiraceae bacterium XBB1006]